MENIMEVMDGEGVFEVEKSEKKCDFDFVFWKMSKDGELCWSLFWGMGCLGWYIECFAMCSDIFG